eukprot:449200-Pyramimonas_sp.AAC.1
MVGRLSNAEKTSASAFFRWAAAEVDSKGPLDAAMLCAGTDGPRLVMDAVSRSLSSESETFSIGH